ncbi:hypothetical protein LXL04_017288 [Taraxacum kok-saghyz]
MNLIKPRASSKFQKDPPSSKTSLAFIATSFELRLMLSAMADPPVNTSIASTIFRFPMIGLVMSPPMFQTSAPTPTPIPKSSTSFSL